MIEELEARPRDSPVLMGNLDVVELLLQYMDGD